MLKYLGIALIVIGAILIWNIPLLGWFFGGMLVFIGISLFSISKGLGMFKTLRSMAPKSMKQCPDCKAPIAGDAKVCMHCGYRYATE